MSNDVTAHADSIARALVQRDTDPNEFAKVATYMRTHRDGAQFFRLLETMVQNGQHLVRSGRTLDYYRNIQDVCRQHLGAYRNAKGEQANELAEIMGWAVRLMRYHQGAGLSQAARPTSQAPSPPSRRVTSYREARPPRDVTQTLAPPPPAVAPAKDLVTREVVTLVEDAKNRKAQVETKDGERLVCTDLPVYPPPKKGARCRAEITRRDGKALRTIFKRWE
jgi:hypothetical protein